MCLFTKKYFSFIFADYSEFVRVALVRKILLAQINKFLCAEKAISLTFENEFCLAIVWKYKIHKICEFMAAGFIAHIFTHRNTDSILIIN